MEGATHWGVLGIAILLSHAALAADSCLKAESVDALRRCPAVRVIVGTAAGGSVDLLARELTQSTQVAANAVPGERGRGGIIVENKPGVNGSNAVNELTREDADNCKFLLTGTSTLVINALNPTTKSMKLDLAKDIQPVGLVSKSPLVLTVNTRLIKGANGRSEFSLDEFLDLMKKGDLNYITSGPGSMSHLMTMEMEKAVGGSRVPNVGVAQGTSGLVQLFTTSVEFALLGPLSLKSMSKADFVVPIANTSDRAIDLGRTKPVPNLSSNPRMGGFEAYSLLGVIANKRADAKAVAAMENAVTCFVRDPLIREKYKKLYYELPEGSVREAFTTQLRTQVEKWTPLMKRAIDESRGIVTPAGGTTPVAPQPAS